MAAVPDPSYAFAAVLEWLIQSLPFLIAAEIAYWTFMAYIGYRVVKWLEKRRTNRS